MSTNEAFLVMVAAIYAVRLHCYMSEALPKTRDDWRKHRKAAIEASITDAVAICEQVELDFPSAASPRDR